MAIDPNNLQGTAHITFDDEFNSLSLWNGSSGTWSTTFWYQDPTSSNGNTLDGNGEQEWYINANYGPTSSVKPWTNSNGVLTLTAAPANSNISSLINGYGYTSGEVNSYHSFSQTYGYFEMRAQLPAGQGFWPAFWLMPEDGAWPPELDVMEVLGNDTTRLYNTVHSLQTGSHTAVGDGGVTVADMSSGYHTYGVDWEADNITFYFDGQAVYQTPTPADMHSPMYMIANLAAGGYWPGSVTPGSVGQMNVDYIRAYASGGDGSAPSATAPAQSAPAQTAPAQTAPAQTAPAQTAPAQTMPAQTDSSGSGQTFTSDNAGDHWTGTAGNDLFNLGRGGDTVTGGAGADTFKFAEVPWAGGHITDFGAGDVIDLTFLQTYGYTGSDPVADGRVKLVADGHGGTQVWADLDGLPVGSGTWLVTTLDNISPANVSWKDGHLVDPPAGASGDAGSTSGAAAPAGGQTFTSDNAGDHWTGTAGNDVFNLGRGGDVAAGNGGDDTFKFAEAPWNAAGHITDFNAGDVLDLSAMFAHYGYAGSDPQADGRLWLASDGHGGTQVWTNIDGLSNGAYGTWLVTDLDNVAPSSLSVGANGVITEGSASASSSSAASTGAPGQTFTSDNAGDHWTGTAGNDVFNLGRGGDTVSGGGGGDTFVLHETPWTGGHITDFQSGDTLDLSGMLAASGYTGGDAVAQGYLAITADAAGEAQVWSHLGGQWWLAETLDHVSPSSLHVNGAFITG